jgi:L-ascorbate metabolism protein UlaG (beta-lactamase superfamily)
MRVRWLGWAGVELEFEGATTVVDPLADAAGTFAALGQAARHAELPAVEAAAAGRAAAGLVSHLHRDHADAGALAAALEPGATVHHPVAAEEANLALAQAEHELTTAGLPRREVAVLHLGDTFFHGAWWQMARRAGPFDVVFAPVDGAVVSFPHQRPASPLPSTMESEQAALAGELLGAYRAAPLAPGETL